MGLSLVSEFLTVLQIMSRRTGSMGDQGRDPILATSHGDSSSDDKTTLANERVARVLQSRFEHRDDDTKPASRRRLVEIANVSSKSHTVSSGASSRCRPTTGTGAFGGLM